MANNKNNAGASLYYYGKNHSQATGHDHNKKIVAIATAVFMVVVFLLGLLYCLCVWIHKNKDEEDVVAGVGNRARQGRQSGEADRAPPPTVAMDMVSPAGRAAEPPLLCTYSTADGWRDNSCGVCLAELADGDVLLVLPLCLHYFHAGCVGEWLRSHGTCPLCRAPLVGPATAA